MISSSQSSSISSPLIVAMDFSDPEKSLSLAKQLNPQSCRLKVGKELFTTAGPEHVRALIDLGFEIFLDLKFHDIPNTVAKAVKASADLGVWMVNVHASGGESMMKAAKAALDGSQTSKPLLIAVTVLTSLNAEELKTIGYLKSPAEQVQHLAQLTKSCGLDGIVCSAQETELLKQQCGQDFCLVTPGIRPAGASTDDQQRIMTPQQALASGSDYLVIGRPITQAENPAQACENILNSL
jgi:orotidine-5'-phosphate decarboxylase